MDETTIIDGLALETYERTGKEETIIFVIPTTWAEAIIRKSFDCSIDEFLGFYTWDTTDYIYRLAESDGVLIQ